MRSTMLWALVLINALLLSMFVARFTRPNSANAQPVRRPGDYIMVPGEVTGGIAGVVYIVDTTNGELSAMTYNENTKKLETMQKKSLAEIFQRGADQNRPNPGNGKKGK